MGNPRPAEQFSRPVEAAAGLRRWRSPMKDAMSAELPAPPDCKVAVSGDGSALALRRVDAGAVLCAQSRFFGG